MPSVGHVCVCVCPCYVTGLIDNTALPFSPKMSLPLEVANWRNRFLPVSIPAPIRPWPHAGNVPQRFRERLHVWKGLNIFCHWTEGAESFPKACWSGMMGVEPVEKSSKTPVGDLHRCWSQTGSSGTVVSRENDVNTSDWWRTVKLPFVKEKQEASCGRLSLSGWGETAGRKPYLRNSEMLSCGLEENWLSI